MTDRNNIHQLKTIAKRYARMGRIAHHEALDLIAHRLDHPHWRALSVAWEKGWRPSDAQWQDMEQLSQDVASPKKKPEDQTPHFLGVPIETHGTIDGHEYELSVQFEVLMGGPGWAIVLEHAPSEKPKIECYDGATDNPILDPRFREKALKIAYAAADELRAQISADWPRRSTKPDAEGRTLHPLWSQLASEWHCLHCEGAFSGAQMAANMWHCPECSATPIDIYVSPFWKVAEPSEACPTGS
ncbi:hypothetical protein JQC79_05820 [Ochrobactrum anthropi]|uniref:hypothetical protein n=1 Tax=Brucella anthropi TaxID=529 RepID=UPI00194DFB57|nr:hypothetical protein [Brucella anthropi]MBM6395273.1 hypothetical protein [Brucella anthropi]